MMAAWRWSGASAVPAFGFWLGAWGQPEACLGAPVARFEVPDGWTVQAFSY